MAITILDGGMGQELIARGKGAPTPLWGAQVMLDEPQLVRDIHSDYFGAGAMVATANTYSLHRDRLAPAGMEDRLEDLHRIACTIAKDARDAFGGGQVAGAVGPLGWSYSHDRAPDVARSAEVYGEVCEIQAPLVDLIIFETIASVDQAQAALTGGVGKGRPIWLALSVDDTDGTKLRSGEALSDVFPLFDRHTPDAVLLNCSTPEAVSQGLPVIAQAGLPFGAYANGFTEIASSFTAKGSTVTQLSARQDLPPVAYADFVDRWIGLGATIVGGCCEVGPAHIAEISRRLSAVAA